MQYRTFPLSLINITSYARFPPVRCRSSVAVSPFPLAVAVSVTPLPLPLPLPLRISERNFLTQFLQNSGILQRQNGETATEERQRNGGNRALHCEYTEERHT